MLPAHFLSSARDSEAWYFSGEERILWIKNPQKARRIMKESPNVIVFFTDQQRWDTTGAHGCPLSLTPNFDAFQDEGTLAENAFTNQPLCTPARACIQIGMYPAALGNFRNEIPLNTDHGTLASFFRQAGYRTAYIGKWHLGTTLGAVPEEERGGYEDWLASNTLELTSNAYHTEVYDEENRPVHLPGYRVDALTDAAIRYIDSHKEKPFFLFLSFLEPHMQNTSDSYPAPDIEKNKVYSYLPPDLMSLRGSAPQHIHGYYGMVKRLDEAFGRVRDALKSLSLSENTILVYASDHGCHFKTRNYEYKRSPHESSIRIPLAFSGGPFTEGGRLKNLISLIDLAPTLLDACGIPVPPHMQGHSILPLLHGDKEGWPEEVLVQISESTVGRAVRTKRWKYAVEAKDKDPMKDNGSDVYEETELYDLENDPYELRNLITFDGLLKVKNVMRQRLLHAMERAGELPPRIIEKPVFHSGQFRAGEGEEYE